LSKAYAETERLILRPLERHELPRLAELIGDWDVARWLVVLPYPYTIKNAEDFYADMHAADEAGQPQFFALAKKTDNLLMGGIGLHPPRGMASVENELEIGYWLGKPYWDLGYMTEAARTVLSLAFKRSSTGAVGATTAPENAASQNVLNKLGLCNLGPMKRDYSALRGDDIMLKWLVTRQEWNS
jgi:RimJ/RimL family protein N-acetyltransferase